MYTIKIDQYTGIYVDGVFDLNQSQLKFEVIFFSFANEKSNR